MFQDQNALLNDALGFPVSSIMLKIEVEYKHSFRE
jgi:hypothetical protein